MENEKRAEKQENEVKLLFEIFREDIVDLRDKDDVMEVPPKLLLCLYPQESNSIKNNNLFVEIKIVCPYDYPTKIPKFTLTRSNGLTNNELTNLKKSINKISQGLKGEIMILDLAMHIQCTLYEIYRCQVRLDKGRGHRNSAYDNTGSPSLRQALTNGPGIGPVQYESFYHEMISNQRTKAMEIEHEKVKKFQTLQKWREEQMLEVEREMVKKKNYSLLGTSQHAYVGSNSTPTGLPPAIAPASYNKPFDISSPAERAPYGLGDGCEKELAMGRKVYLDMKIGDIRPYTFVPLNQLSQRKIMAQSDIYTTSLCLIDPKDTIILKDYNLSYSPDGRTEIVVASLRSLLNTLSQKWDNTNALQHPNLGKIYGTSHTETVTSNGTVHSKKIGSGPSPGSQIKFALEREFIFGSTLSTLLKSQYSFDWNAFRRFVCEIISTLAYLNEHDVLHLAPKLKDLYVDNRGTLKIVDFGVASKLKHVFQKATVWLETAKKPPKVNNSTAVSDIINFIEDEKVQLSTSATFKDDIIELGNLLLTIVSHCSQSNLTQLRTAVLPEDATFSAPTKPINGKVKWDGNIPCDLRPELKNFIELCIGQKNATQAITLRDLRGHPLLKDMIDPRTPKGREELADEGNLVTKEMGDSQANTNKADRKDATTEKVPENKIYHRGRDGDATSARPLARHLSIPSNLSQSRLLQEFEIMEWIGRGGFGDVIKVRNELDDRVYAIKRIPIIDKSPAYRKFNRKITREIKLLSSLNHENIVRYYNSWFETFDDSTFDKEFTGLFGFQSPTSPADDGPLESQNINNENDGENSLFSQPKPIIYDDPKARPPCDNLSAQLLKMAAAGKINDPFFDRTASLKGQDDQISTKYTDGTAGGGTPFTYSFFHYFSSSEDDDDDDTENSSISSTSTAFPSPPESFGVKAIDKEDSCSSVIFTVEGGIGDGGENHFSKEDTFSQTGQFKEKVNDDITLLNTDEAGKNNFNSSNDIINSARRYICIQMEYCENNTLRNAIDDSRLYEQPQRAWRYFRETIEGLVYLHEQGIVHRDLKPVNIFLDSKDHIKIGDFGLATTQIFGKDVMFEDNVSNNPHQTKNLRPNTHQQVTLPKESEDFLYLSTKVGTALYVAPEISFSDSKIFKYNQKVDIYSLGIIFFEIWFPPAPTSMERFKILTNLRHSSIKIPEIFEENFSNQAEILKWLLAHDPDRRPTSKELLMSGRLPPLELEEIQLDNVIQRAINNPLSFPYRKIISSLFDQKYPSATSDYAYDIDLRRSSSHPVNFFENSSSLKTGLARGGQTSSATKPSCCAPEMIDSLYNHYRMGVLSQTHTKLLNLLTTAVFEKHGAHYVSIPLLMPPCGPLREVLPFGIPMIDRSGGLVTLPGDPRIALARYLAHNNVVGVKRYSMDRVYKESKLIYTHPKEHLELTYDIVTPSSRFTSLADAEILYTFQQIISYVPVLKDREYLVQLNHMSLIIAVFTHFNIPAKYYSSIIDIMISAHKKMRSTKASANQKLLAEIKSASGYKIQECCGLSPSVIEQIFDLFEVEDAQFTRIISLLVTKFKPKKGSAVHQLIERAANEVGETLKLLKILGFQLTLSFGLRMGLGPNQPYKYYSGIMFNILDTTTVAPKKKYDKTCSIPSCLKNSSIDVLATGGRYDKLLRAFQFSTALGSSKCSLISPPSHHDSSPLTHPSLLHDYTIQSVWENPQDFSFTNSPHGVGMSLAFDKIIASQISSSRVSRGVKYKSGDAASVENKGVLYDFLILFIKGQRREESPEVCPDTIKAATSCASSTSPRAKTKNRRPKRHHTHHRSNKGDRGVDEVKTPFNYDALLLPLLANVSKLIWDSGATLCTHYSEFEKMNDIDDISSSISSLSPNLIIFSPDFIDGTEMQQKPVVHITYEQVPFVFKSSYDGEGFGEKYLTLPEFADSFRHLMLSTKAKNQNVNSSALSRSCQDISSSNTSLNNGAPNTSYNLQHHHQQQHKCVCSCCYRPHQSSQTFSSSSSTITTTTNSLSNFFPEYHGRNKEYYPYDNASSTNALPPQSSCLSESPCGASNPNSGSVPAGGPIAPPNPLISVSSFASVTNVTFVTSEKLSAYVKRKYETQVISRLYENSSLAALASSLYHHVRSSKTVIEVVVVELHAVVLRAFCAYVDILSPVSPIVQTPSGLSSASSPSYDRSENSCVKRRQNDPEDFVSNVYEKYPKCRKPVTQIIEHIQKLKSIHKEPFFCLLYSYKDNYYKIL